MAHEAAGQDSYSHGHHESVVASHGRRTAADSAAFVLPYLEPGRTVLDVGAGPGSITADFAAIVAPAPVTGIDRSAGVVEQARAAAAARGLGNVSFTTGDVYALDYPDGEFDVVHAHQVLQHLSDPVAALRQMCRVSADIVAVREADFAGMFWYPRLPELDEWMALYQRIARGNGAEPDAGRHLPAWAHAAGVTDVVTTSSNWLYATDESRRDHASSWARRVLESAYADQALDRGLATRAQLERIAAGWLRWGEDPDGWFLIPNAEIIARVGGA